MSPGPSDPSPVAPLSQTWQGMGQASVTSSRLEEPVGSSSRRLRSEAGVCLAPHSCCSLSLELSPLLAIHPTLPLGLSLNVTSPWLVTFLDSALPSAPSW